VEFASENAFKFLFYDVNWLFFCGGMFFTCVLIVVMVSMFTPQASEDQLRGLTFGSVTPEQKAITRASWNHWDIIHTGIILAFTAVFYWYFW